MSRYSDHIDDEYDGFSIESSDAETVNFSSPTPPERPPQPRRTVRVSTQDVIEDEPAPQPNTDGKRKAAYVAIAVLSMFIVSAGSILAYRYVDHRNDQLDHADGTSASVSTTTVTTAPPSADVQSALMQQRLQTVEEQLKIAREDRDKAIEDVNKLKEANKKMADEYKAEREAEGRDNSNTAATTTVIQEAAPTTVTVTQTAEPAPQQRTQSNPQPSGGGGNNPNRVDNLTDLFR